MQITITFDPQDPAQVAHAICMLNGTYTSKPTQPQVVENSGSTGTGLILSPGAGAGDAAGAEAASTAVDAPAATRRGRKPKEAVVPEGKSVNSAEAKPGSSGASGAGDTTATETTASRTDLTLDDVRAKLQAFTVAKGVPAGIELLKKFEAARISELPAEKYADFVKACEVVA